MEDETNEKLDEVKKFVFSEDEVLQMRQGISGEVAIPDDLMEKVQSDPLYKEFFVTIFFPVVGERIKQGEIPKVELMQTETRSRALKVTFDDGAYVIKSIENSQEPVIAKIMAEIGVGPEQFESINGYITEKFIEGKAINQFNDDKNTPESMNQLGVKIGDAVKKIHEKGILVNDQLFSDDFGKSHTIIGSDGEICFIDFGASIDLNKYPDISDESVMLIMRSDAFASMSLHGASGERLIAIINNYRKTVLENLVTKEDVIKRYDGQLIGEGFSFLSRRINNVGDLVKGFRVSNES